MKNEIVLGYVLCEYKIKVDKAKNNLIVNLPSPIYVQKSGLLLDILHFNIVSLKTLI